MALRSGKCYRKIERPYTRISSKKPKKGYVKGVPALKLHRFEAGVNRPEYTARLYLVAKSHVQIRHNALEASRVAAVKALTKDLGENNFFVKVLIYPFHVLRENPLATGAGADRFQTGMRLAFGRPIGSAAQVRPNQKIMEIRIPPTAEDLGKKALKIAASKLPTACVITR